MLEPFVVKHCSPTLANLKTANLFGYVFSSLDELQAQVARLKAQLVPKGVGVEVLEVRKGRALIYLYRCCRLNRELQCPETQQLLKNFGYSEFTVSAALHHLSTRIAQEEGEFPHEIGVFLGYPLGDVKGFIENRGKNSKCVGCWKVYCDVCEAQKQFCRFEKCRTIYCKLFEGGRTLQKLTVAA